MTPPEPAELEERLAALRGEVELPIPAASAVKIGGERAYRLARRGVEVAMPTRRSQVHALDVVAYAGGVATLDLRVSSGTYVRAIAAALGGHCRTLRRLEIGPFSVDAADPERMLAAGGGARAPAGRGARPGSEGRPPPDGTRVNGRSRPARRRGQPARSGSLARTARSKWRASSSKATGAASCSAFRRRTSTCARSRSCRRAASTPAPRWATGPRSRSASTRTTVARPSASRRTCSTSTATSTGSASRSSCGSACATSDAFGSEAELVEAIAADVEAARAAVRP